ncbi:hypothetical protein MW887_003280 [Aspergillus wentii]|nr:hypothetical protein MW887_003280 [Aspergillus wentii]
MAASNDLRGWVMSGVSGVACVLGSAVICADMVVRRFSRQKNFQIANSNGFLSASLCLSAGVMLFTSLYSMLPTSKQYLTRAGLSARASAYTLIGLFLAGVIVIRVVSGFIHAHIPSHVVDCAHTHDDHDAERGEPPTSEVAGSQPDTVGGTERTPLLKRAAPQSWRSGPAATRRARSEDNHMAAGQLPKEPFRARLTRRLNQLMGDVKPLCDENGPCYGFSQTCGRECTKTASSKAPTVDGQSRRPSLTQQSGDHETGTVSTGLLEHHPRAFSEGVQRSDYFDAAPTPELHHASSSSSHSEFHQYQSKSQGDDLESAPLSGSQHHHHVPQNAFLSIGLQTSLAIALHKLPEGFITYATNHASPTLGLTVFLALFIHNISEGFVMALPLYLALNSRWRAMFWSSLLGGISQPAGAGIAALWIWSTQKTGDDTTMGPSWGVYGGMFAATSGIMTSVALQLFSEGLGLTHKRGMGIGFAIAGMGLMGMSFALTA